MSLKGIELQIAIPKTLDAGKIAEQKQQRAQLTQDQAGVRMEKQVKKDKETVVAAEQSGKADPYNLQRKGPEHEWEHSRKEGKKETKHPYKGSFVDFSR